MLRCQDTMIGSSFVRGVSGGERKRVCIGNEIIINPSLLFLDEPTSGLDSTTALRIVQILQDIAEVYCISSPKLQFHIIISKFKIIYDNKNKNYNNKSNLSSSQLLKSFLYPLCHI